MATVILNNAFYASLHELDRIVINANNRKIELLFDVLGIKLSSSDFAMILDWDLIIIAVADKQMAVQLNKLAAYVPNLKFVVDSEQELFAVLQGKKVKRVWKER